MTKEIETVGVIGAGDYGREFTLALLTAGYRVILEDVSENRLAEAVDWIAREDPALRLRLVLASAVEEAVREADLIIEAVADEMEMKIEMFTIFDRFARPDAVLASSSCSIPIVELADVTFCPERCIGMRLIPAAAHRGTLELVCAPNTSEETVARCADVGRRMAKEVVIMGNLGTDAPLPLLRNC